MAISLIEHTEGRSYVSLAERIIFEYIFAEVDTNKKNPTLAGFEPAREDPNGFQVHRLNHSATMSFLILRFSSSK